AIALIEYEKQSGYPFASAGGDGPGSGRHGWLSRVLKDIGRVDLAKQYSFSVGWDHPNNQAVISTRIADLECPSAPSERMPGGYFGPCPMNCTNDNEIYSFHSGGACFAFAEGTVRFIRDDLSNEIVLALISRAGHDQALAHRALD